MRSPLDSGAPAGNGNRPAPPARVLVVEDEAVVALEIQLRLRQSGFTVVGIADDLAGAVAAAAQHQPDLILMDMHLRGGDDGVEAARRILEDRPVPVVFLTAYGSDDRITHALGVAPYGYVLKPFAPAALVAAIQVALGRARAEARTRLLARALDAVPVAVAVLDATAPERPVVWGNRAHRDACAALGCDGQGRAFRFQGSTEDGAVPPVLEGALAAGTEAAATYVHGAAEAPAWTAASVAPLPEPGQALAHLVVTQVDVTRLRTAEAALLEAQRSELMARLYMGMAHDFNNLLGAILTHASIARERAMDEEMAEDLDAILDATRRSAALTRKLLDFVRRSPRRGADICDAGAVAHGLVPVVGRLIGSSITITWDIDAAALPVGIDGTAFEQLVLNLLTNARDAAGPSGRVWVAVRAGVGEPGEGPAALDGAPVVRLSVTDSGPGIDAANLTRIFEPLFTTKPRGQGTGIGLSTCAALAQRAGGDIRAESPAGAGAPFIVVLPRRPAPAIPVAEPAR